jgi:uncharacterized damage-inducible protein DinB
MDSRRVVEEFENSWAYTRNMTNEFIKCVPEDKWNFSYHPKFGALSKQFRHMVCVYGCYIDAFKTREMDLAKKKSYYSKPLERQDILSALDQMDLQLKAVLADLKNQDLNEMTIDFFGQAMGFCEFCDVLIQHECAHFGIWSNYAAFGEFDTPEMWKNDWKL